MLTGNNLILNSQNAANGVWRNISNWMAFSIHITGVEAKVWIEISNDPSVMTDGATISAPGSPVLSQYTPAADSHIAGVAVGTTYFVKTTFVTPSGETVPSTQSSLLVTAGNLLSVASPAKDTGGYATGWNVYISTVTNTETLQNLEDNAVIAPLRFGQSFALKNLVNSQIVVPVSNTSGSPNSGINVTPPDIITAAGGSALGQGYLDMTELIYDATGHQAVWTPSCLVYNFIRVCKDTSTQSLTTKAFLFGQQG